MIKTVAIGSTNPVKVGAVREALGKLFPKAKFVGVEVDSGVSRQPMSDEETLRGARNRAKAALKKVGADMGVGLEGGVMPMKEGMMNTVWCCLVMRDGDEFVSGGEHFLLPPRWAKKLVNGKEVAEILDDELPEKNVREKQGMIGVLTRGLISRQEAYAKLVKLATMKLQSPEVYS